MDFSQVKAITIPEGDVKKIEIGGVTVWEKKVPIASISIDNSDPLEVKRGDSYSVSCTVLPADATDKRVYWYISDHSHFLVNPTTGNPTHIGAFPDAPHGTTATLSVYDQHTGTISDSITVTVL